MKTRRKLVSALELTRKWLLMDQPKGAVMSHFGGSIDAAVNGREVYIQCAPRGDAGAWLCINLRKYYKVVKKAKTCPTCKHHFPEVTEPNPFLGKDKNEVHAAIKAVFGDDALCSEWGGGDFLAFDIKAKCGQDCQNMIQRYHDGCPQCNGSVFCSTSNHPWHKGFAKARNIDDV